MKRYPSIGALPLGGPRRVVAIGTFDGVHLGHRAVVGRAREVARSRGVANMVLTFEPHPLAILRPELAPTVLTPPAVKADLLADLGVDELLVVPFTPSFARTKAERFAEMLSAAPIGADCVVVGDGFRFGHGGAGTVGMLKSYGRARGLAVETPETVASPDGKPVSSTRIRRLIAQGRVEDVIPLLSRRHRVDGEVIDGDGRGRQLGFPTANLAIDPHIAVPAHGVYAAVVHHPRGVAPAAVNIGTSPTFVREPTPSPRLEAHLLDYDGPDFYGATIAVEFVARLRDEERFASVDDLVAQMRRDVERTRALVGDAARARVG